LISLTQLEHNGDVTVKLIEKDWEAYRETADILPYQEVECRKAFYYGASCVLSILLDSVEFSTQSPQDDFQLLENIHTEIWEFVEAMAGGEV
jgi:hypothetical protein